MDPIYVPLIDLGRAFEERGMKPPKLTVCDETWFRLLGEITPMLTERSERTMPDGVMVVSGLIIERERAHQK